MKNQRVVICALAWGGWYSRGIARMIERFHDCSPGFELQAWVNVLPPGSRIMHWRGYDYTAYAAKPRALAYARASGADIAILLDAAFYPIRPIHPLIEHIAQTGYYFCRNGNNVGEWSSDACLENLGVTREQAMDIPEISSYCVGLNFAHEYSCGQLLTGWCAKSNERTIPGYHDNVFPGSTMVGQLAMTRNPGLVSNDPRVRGHRHDQTVLSVAAHRLGMNNLISRPLFTSYLGSETEETVLVNEGMG